LSKRIRELQGCQRVYIPGIADLLDVSQEDERLEDRPEVLKLWLPSQLSNDDRSAWCLPGIPYLESRFRYAQASDTLAELRRLRQLLQGTRDQNDKHTKSTTSTTRSQGILDSFHVKIKRVANRYRDARRALLALDPEEKLTARWKHYFLELRDADIRGPDREINEPSEGRFQQSWIWTVSCPLPHSSDPISSDPQHAVTNPTSPHEPPLSASIAVSSDGSGSPIINTKEQDQSHRAHWARAQARAERYEEEVKLTVEEMGRTLQYFKWKRSWWRSILSERSQSGNPPPPNVQDGLHAYAHRQSFIYDKLVTLFVNHWRGFLLAHSLGLLWLCNYPLDTHPILPTRPCRGHRGSIVGPSAVADAPRKPTATGHIPKDNTTLQGFTSQLKTTLPTLDDSTDAPLDHRSNDEDSDDDFVEDYSWDGDSDDDD
jgi:hypothetical protein